VLKLLYVEFVRLPETSITEFCGSLDERDLCDITMSGDFGLTETELFAFSETSILEIELFPLAKLPYLNVVDLLMKEIFLKPLIGGLSEASE
ncbi:hypothetical protein SK128_016339, partial [Halocaridina rubra]